MSSLMDVLENKKPTSVRLTPEDITMIIKLRLNHTPFADIAKEVGCSETTCKKHWNKYLATEAKENATKDISAVKEEIAQGYQDILTKAQYTYKLALAGRQMVVNGDIVPDTRAANDSLKTIISAMEKLAKLRGINEVTEIKIDFQSMSDAELEAFIKGN